MDHLAHRCAAVAAAALTAGGLFAALTSMTQPLPDMQIRDFDLAARNVDMSPLVETIENHMRPDLSGAGDEDAQHVSLGDLLYGRGLGSFDGVTDPSSNSSNLTMDDPAWTALLGGGFDPQALQDAGLSIVPIDVGAIGGSVTSTAGVFGGTEQAAGAAVASTVNGIAMALQGLPAAYQAFTVAVAAVESDLNSSLVAAQVAAAERLFGDNPEVNDVVNWIFTVNNTLLAQHESAFNSLFGIPLDAHSSLLGHLDPVLTDADWSVLFGLSPDAFNDIVNAIQSDNMSLLGSIDWDGLFAGLF